jgi:hypothetical protein
MNERYIRKGDKAMSLFMVIASLPIVIFGVA